MNAGHFLFPKAGPARPWYERNREGGGGRGGWHVYMVNKDDNRERRGEREVGVSVYREIEETKNHNRKTESGGRGRGWRVYI